MPLMPIRKCMLLKNNVRFAVYHGQTLLHQRGINYSFRGVQQDSETGEPALLPLEYFDDADFDCREPQEWLSLGKPWVLWC